MKKYFSLIFFLLIVHFSGFTQLPKSKVTLDCNEINFWFKEIQLGFKNVMLPSSNEGLISKKAFIGFDSTSIKNLNGHYSVKGISWEFKNKEEAKAQYKKLIATLKSCFPKIKITDPDFMDFETTGFTAFEYALPSKKYISIIIRWDDKSHKDGHPFDLSFTIYFTK